MKQYFFVICTLLSSKLIGTCSWDQPCKNYEEILATLVNNELNVSAARWIQSADKYIPEILQFRKISAQTEKCYQEHLAPMIKRLMSNIASALYLEAQKEKGKKLSPTLKQACADFTRLFGTQPDYREYYDKYLKILGV